MYKGLSENHVAIAGLSESIREGEHKKRRPGVMGPGVSATLVHSTGDSGWNC